jgi:hypothetical protein
MEEHRDCPSGVCPDTSTNCETVSIHVPLNHPLLQLKRALPWDALAAVMERHWRQAGKNTDRRPGFPWNVALYVPLVVLMLVKHLNAREMEAYLAENVVARVFMGHQTDPSPPIRDHSNIARAYTALGKDGVEEVNALILHVAHNRGCADASILSSDTTAQELPMGYPTNPGSCGGGHSAVAAPWRSSKRGGSWESMPPSHRSRRSSGRSKNTTCVPRAHRQSVRC